MSYIFADKLTGKVALVTGASRGIGKGIATMLIQAGATVYITGREKSEGKTNLKEVAANLNSLNKGKCIAIFCDHSKDDQVESLFSTIDKNHSGQLDILVNNAFSGVTRMASSIGKKYWDIDYKYWDDINNVGLRSTYVCSVLASRMMVKNQSGLIVNISSIGGIKPLFSTAYGVNKEGNDRMTQEMAREIKSQGITVVSLWPGAVRTEIMTEVVNKNPNGQMANLWNVSEDVTLTGKAVVAIAADPNRIIYTGRILFVAELAHYYDFKDIDDKYPISMRSLRFFVHIKFPNLSWVVPHAVKIPCWFLTLYYSKF